MLNFDAIKACSYFLPKSDTYSYAGIHLLPTAEAIRLEATDGHIAIRIEYTPEEIWADMEEAFYSLSQVKEYVRSKGYSTLENNPAAVRDYPDIEAVIPDEYGITDQPFGLGPLLLDKIVKASRALGQGNTPCVFSIKSSTSPAKITFSGEKKGVKFEVLIVLMPMRLQ